jgi:Eukaryotic protein of unknown function (DUF829)
MTIQGTRRPLVILAGWLGGRVSQLKRYEELYQSIGMDTVSMVVSTVAIVDCTLTMQQNQRQQNQRGIIFPKHQWTSQSIHEMPPAPPSRIGTIQDWAWYTLQTIHGRQPPYYFVHVFSNGGCFLWESICRILEEHTYHGNATNQSPHEPPVNTTSLSQNQHQPDPFLEQLATTCQGVIFDSCPAWFGNDPSGLWRILQQHCSAEDLQQVLDVFGEDRLRRVPAARNQEYFDYLIHNTSMCTSQLYLYSMDDPLSHAESIAKLVQERRKQLLRLGHGSRHSPVILEHVWDQSMHCAHLLQHPEEYRHAIIEFVQLATTFQSKL